LRELISGQAIITESLSRKLASNDRILENMSNKMDNFSSTIKNQHSLNKMIESQIAQLAVVVPLTDKGKILGQQEDLETKNLVDIYNTAYYYIQPSMGR
jgi:CII-binding regulator of phage lambda lysogenization HflD